jgi:hypothetical protein
VEDEFCEVELPLYRVLKKFAKKVVINTAFE